MNQHLSEEDLEELLSGSSSARVYAHIRACASCQLEAARLSEGVEFFKKASFAWAEQRMSRSPVLHPATRKSILFDFSVLLRAAAAVVLCAGAVGTANHMRSHVAQQGAITAPSIAQENSVLLGIDQELRAEEPSPRLVYKTPSSDVE